MTDSFQSALKGAGAMIGRILADDGFPESIEPDFLRNAVRDYPLRGGKRLRPALLIWSCGLLGGELRKASFAAASVEIYHNWTLVHDDIIDGDSTRRGVPTSHVSLASHGLKEYSLGNAAAGKFGSDFAILAGDLQQAWAFDMLMRSSSAGCAPELTLKLAMRLQQSVARELISGEALDVEFPLRMKSGSLSRTDVERMLSWKTGSLLKFCAQCGGAIALGAASFDEPPLSMLGSFAESLGVAFQLRDDYLGVFAEQSAFGKPPCSDFKERKPTILYLEALERLDSKGRSELESLTGLPQYDGCSIERLRALLTDSGAADAVLQRASGLSSKAMQSLSPLPDGHYKKLLSELADYILGRHL